MIKIDGQTDHLFSHLLIYDYDNSDYYTRINARKVSSGTELEALAVTIGGQHGKGVDGLFVKFSDGV